MVNRDLQEQAAEGVQASVAGSCWKATTQVVAARPAKRRARVANIVGEL